MFRDSYVAIYRCFLLLTLMQYYYNKHVVKFSGLKLANVHSYFNQNLVCCNWDLYQCFLQKKFSPYTNIQTHLKKIRQSVFIFLVNYRFQKFCPVASCKLTLREIFFCGTSLLSPTMIILKDETHTSHQTRDLEIWTSYFFFF